MTGFRDVRNDVGEVTKFLSPPHIGGELLAQVRAAAGELRAWDAVAVIGAGISVMPGFPLTHQLSALVHHAIDADLDSAAALASALRRDSVGPAKELVGSDPSRLEKAFQIIALHATAREAFQQGFSRLNAERLPRPSPAHTALAELLHRRIVTKVVSLNWDTRLEAAYSARYGGVILANSDWLHKPHGDAAHPHEPWILPHERGTIPNQLVAELEQLATERPSVLLIVGYSENDDLIVERIIEPLASRWRVCRIGPDAHGDLAIRLSAEEALPLLLDALELPPETPGWEYVGFHIQRDIGSVGSALAGRKLGPRDAAACPRLPEVARLRQAVEATGSGLLIGGSGTGKSVTCYQVALDLSCDGWEVVRLQENGSLPDESVAAVLRNLPRPTLAIIDNAQRLLPRLLQRLLDEASPTVRIIAASTDPLPSFGEAIEIGAERAVAVLAEAFRKRKREILPIVRALDDRVGEGYMDESLNMRIDHAESSATSPWEFAFSLAGGWRRANDMVVVLRDHNRADMLLVAVAARQIATIDGAVPPAWLRSIRSTLGRDSEWIESATELLINRRAVLADREGCVRCPHARFAEVVLRQAFRLPKDEQWEVLNGVVRSAIESERPPLRGIFRLLFDLFHAEAFPWAAEDLLDDALLQQLIDRCWSAAAGPERGPAAYLLMALLRWRKGPVLSILAENVELLAQWVNEAKADAAYGLGSLANDVCNEDPELAKRIAASCDAVGLAAKLSGAAVREWVAWDLLVNTLAAEDGWRVNFRGGLDEQLLIETIGRLPAREAPYFNYVVKIVARVDDRLALQLIGAATEMLGTTISRSPADSMQALRDVIWFVLGYAPEFLRRRQPDRTRQRIARAMVRKLDGGAISSAFADAARRDWTPLAELLFWIDEVDEQLSRQIVREVDIESLDTRAEGLWGTFPDEMKELLAALAAEPDREPARSWLLRHAADLERTEPIMAIISPEAVVAAQRNGHILDLQVGSGLGWGQAAAALRLLHDADSAQGLAALEGNVEPIAKGLSLPQADMCEDLVTFLDTIEEMAPHTAIATMALVDTSTVESNWAARLRGRAVERRAVKRLLYLCHRSGGDVAEMADRLRQRFPSVNEEGAESRR